LDFVVLGVLIVTMNLNSKLFIKLLALAGLTLTSAFCNLSFAAGEANGKILYNQIVSGTSCSNSGCHGTDPTLGQNKINNGKNNPTLILSAINANTGGMGIYKGIFTTAQLTDIAAYIANPAAANGTPIISASTPTFASTNIGSTSSATVTVSNTGTAALSFSAAPSIAASDFTINATGTTCSTAASVAATNGSCTINITFTPTVNGARTGVLTLKHNATSAAATTTTVNLTATGVGAAAITVAPTTLAFGQMTQGSSSTAQSSTITNSGTANLVLSGVALTPGTNTVAGEFSLGTATGTCTSTTSLAPKATCTVTATFSPSSTSTTGAKSASVSIAHNATGSPSSIALTGTSGAALPSITGTPLTLAFGSITVGSTSASQKVTLTNSGQADLTFTSFVFSGTNMNDFKQTTTCGTTLAKTLSCDVNVTYTPAAAGAGTATLSVNTNASNTPKLDIALSGTGVVTAVPSILISPASLSFMATTVNTAAISQTFTIKNSGQASLTVSSIALSGTNVADYTQTSACVNVAIAPNTSCTVTVGFKPVAASAGRTATVTIMSNASNATVGGDKVSLTGDGVALPVPLITSDITVTPVKIDFPATTVNVAAAGITFNITNNSVANAAGQSATLNISGIAISGTNASEFSKTTTCGTTLAVGASCAITVGFTPTAINARSASLVVNSNANNAAAYTVALNGSGTAAPTPAITLSTPTVAFGNQLVGTASGAQTVTVSNTGSASLTVSTVTSSDAVFAVSNNTCTTAVAAGASCSIDVTFKPIAVGGKTGSLTVSGSGLTGTVAMTGAGLAATGGAVNGQTLYLANCSSSGCHTPNVVTNVNRVQLGLVAPAISNAINKNMGGMGYLSSLTTSELNDIAAYIGVQIGQPSTPISTTPTQGGGATPATTNVGGGGCTIANNDGTTQLPVDPLLLLMVGISAAVLVRRQMKR
jgi:trimeric autotransporter adhesin